MHTYLSRDCSQNHMAVLQLNPEHSIRERFDDRTLHFNGILFDQKDRFFLKARKTSRLQKSDSQ